MAVAFVSQAASQEMPACNIVAGMFQCFYGAPTTEEPNKLRLLAVRLINPAEKGGAYKEEGRGHVGSQVRSVSTLGRTDNIRVGRP